jgi:hypothetical protein
VIQGRTPCSVRFHGRSSWVEDAAQVDSGELH